MKTRVGLAMTTTLVCAALTAVTASAASTAALPVSLVSGPTPLPTTGCAAGPRLNAEVEPSLSADPSHPGRLVAAWRQDGDEITGAARIVAASVSPDGNPRNEQALPADLTCYVDYSANSAFNNNPLGPATEGSFDSWLSTGPDGLTYLSRVVYGISQPTNPLGGFRVEVLTSPDDGAHWSPPAIVADDKVFTDDKATITADPHHPGRAYVVWTRYDTAAGVGLPMIAETDDAGTKWSTPSVITAPMEGSVAASAQLMVLPDGSLACSFVAFPPQPVSAAEFFLGFQERTVIGPVSVEITRSSDEGQTWTTPTIVDHPTDFGLVAATTSPDGRMWLTWADPHVGLVVATSSDGGDSWSTTVARTAPGLTTPAIAATNTSVAVLTYDDAEPDTDGAGRTTLARILRSGDGGVTWNVTPVGPAFNKASAPDGDLGAYQSLVATAGRFVAALTLPKPAALLGQSDIFIAALDSR